MGANILVDPLFLNGDNTKEPKSIKNENSQREISASNTSVTYTEGVVKNFSKNIKIQLTKNIKNGRRQSDSEVSRLEQGKDIDQVDTFVDGRSNSSSNYENEHVKESENDIEKKSKTSYEDGRENEEFELEFESESKNGSIVENTNDNSNGNRNNTVFESENENEMSNRNVSKVENENINAKGNANENDKKSHTSEKYTLNLNAKERFMKNRKAPQKKEKKWEIGNKINDMYKKENGEGYVAGETYSNAANRRDFSRRKSRKSYYRSSATQLKGYATGHKSGYIIDLPPENKKNDEKKNTKKISPLKKEQPTDNSKHKETTAPPSENMFYENLVLCLMGMSSILLYNYFLNTTSHINGLLNDQIQTSDTFLLYYVVLITGSVLISFFFEYNVLMFESCFILSIILQLIYPFVIKYFISMTFIFQGIICFIAIVCSVLKTMVFSIASIIQDNSKIICLSYGISGMYSFLFTFIFYFGIMKVTANANKFVQAVFATSIINCVFMSISFILYIHLKHTPKYRHKMQCYFDSCKESNNNQAQKTSATDTNADIGQEGEKKIKGKTQAANDHSDEDLESKSQLCLENGEELSKIKKKKKHNKEKRQGQGRFIAISPKMSGSSYNLSTVVSLKRESKEDNVEGPNMNDNFFKKQNLVNKNGQNDKAYVNTKGNKEKKPIKQLLDINNEGITMQGKAHNKQYEKELHLSNKNEEDPNYFSYMAMSQKSCCKLSLSSHIKNMHVVKELKYKISLYKKAWMPLFCVFYNIFLKVLVFPIVCPEMWTTNTNFRYVLIGFTQLAECVSRIFPTYASNIPAFSFFVLSPKNLFCQTLAKTLLAFLCLAVAVYDNVVFNNHIFKLSLIFVYMYLNGWYVVTSFINMPVKLGSANSSKNRAIVSSFGSSLLRLGLLFGFGISRIFKLICVTYFDEYLYT